VTGLLGPNGRPISSRDFKNKKANPPKTGEAFGAWAGRDVSFAQLPGGGVVQFDLSKLTLSDFRAMRDHYQVNASLSVLTFMLHQVDWHIVCEDKKIADLCEEQLREIWTPLNRSLGTANWAGYSPNALNWENDTESRTVRLDKVKDLYPEECRVNWKEVDGWSPPGKPAPKFKVYDGIKQTPLGYTTDDEGRVRRGWSYPIPVENSFWYPLLMENGDYSGRKLLRPAFTSWYFSILVHLFANRYYERFGEPTPIGRAPFDEEFPQNPDTTSTEYGNVKMLEILSTLRSRGAVVLPNDRMPTGAGDATEYEYDIEYLESQMRGADFERYMTRLDEEISLGIFTPILLMRTADVGSYNLGVGHMQIWLWMLNALCGDRKEYIDKYILRKIADYNFSPKSPSPKIVFKKLGDQNMEMIKAILVELIKNNKAKPDLEELGQMAGLSLTEVRELSEVEDPPPGGNPGEEDLPLDTSLTRSTANDILTRVRPQIQNAFRDGRFGPDLKPSLGYKSAFEKSLEAEGFDNAAVLTNTIYNRLDRWIEDVVRLGPDEISGPDTFMGMLEKVLTNEIESLPNAR
jgi:hypothetical protein